MIFFITPWAGTHAPRSKAMGTAFRYRRVWFVNINLSVNNFFVQRRFRLCHFE